MSITATLLLQVIPLGFVFAILYLVFIRPQQKQLNAHKELIKQLKEDDLVITEGGIYARIIKQVDEKSVQVEVSPNVLLRVQKKSIAELVQN